MDKNTKPVPRPRAKTHATAVEEPLRQDADAIGRRHAVVQLVGFGGVVSQAELARRLKERGYQTTQATLSRDLKALRIGKVPAAGQGYVYVLPAAPRDVVDSSRSQWELEVFVREVKLVGNLVLLRTPPGNAQGVARVLDHSGWEEVQGTISGDDTVLVVTSSTEQAQAFRERLIAHTGRRL